MIQAGTARRRGAYERYVKRPLDVAIVALIALPALAVLAIACLVVRVDVGRPLFFRQRRPGRGGQVFTLFKLRTMRDAVDADGNPLPDEHRLTAAGNLLRKLSIDEIPTLLNVLRGDMSLVGPRPLLVSYLERYTPEQRRRHDVRPGVTGWAQVNGRNALSWPEKFAYDCWYVDHLSFMLDLRILLRTLATVLRREGIAEQGHVTMSEFKG